MGARYVTLFIILRVTLCSVKVRKGDNLGGIREDIEKLSALPFMNQECIESLVVPDRVALQGTRANNGPAKVETIHSIPWNSK